MQTFFEKSAKKKQPAIKRAAMRPSAKKKNRECNFALLCFN